MMRTGVAPVWRLRHSSDAKNEVVIPLTPRLLSDDMIALKHAAIAGLGVVALPGYVCREDVRSGALRRMLPSWLAGDSTFTALIAYRQGLLPSVRVFVDYLAAEFANDSTRRRLRPSAGMRRLALAAFLRVPARGRQDCAILLRTRERNILASSSRITKHRMEENLGAVAD